MSTEQHAHLQRCRRLCPGGLYSGCTMLSVHGCPGSPDTAPTGNLQLRVPDPTDFRIAEDRISWLPWFPCTAPQRDIFDSVYRITRLQCTDSFRHCIPYNSSAFQALWLATHCLGHSELLCAHADSAFQISRFRGTRTVM